MSENVDLARSIYAAWLTRRGSSRWACCEAVLVQARCRACVSPAPLSRAPRSKPQRSPFRAFERQSNWERNRGFAEPAWRTRARCARVRRLQQPLGEGRRPFSCFGFFCGGGGRGYSCTPGAFSLPVSAACVGQLLSTIRGSLRDGVGKDGTVALGATSRLNAAVMSPVCSRRHWLKFGTSGPNRRSRKRSSEVWSNVFLHTSPPRVNGE